MITPVAVTLTLCVKVCFVFFEASFILYLRVAAKDDHSSVRSSLGQCLNGGVMVLHSCQLVPVASQEGLLFPRTLNLHHHLMELPLTWTSVHGWIGCQFVAGIIVHSVFRSLLFFVIQCLVHKSNRKKDSKIQS